MMTSDSIPIMTTNLNSPRPLFNKKAATAVCQTEALIVIEIALVSSLPALFPFSSGFHLLPASPPL